MPPVSRVSKPKPKPSTLDFGSKTKGHSSRPLSQVRVPFNKYVSLIHCTLQDASAFSGSSFEHPCEEQGEIQRVLFVVIDTTESQVADTLLLGDDALWVDLFAPSSLVSYIMQDNTRSSSHITHRMS